ncbi:P-loop ATPase, Sll1717 family [Streptomyces sp. NPDC090080]|uniref:P-loop ATPase, Sll1717 family n=1 Tax=Streptomyces sp. NPDC090080 TaxID=3365939 RepID=UPI0038269A55
MGDQLDRPVRDLFFGRDDAEHDFADGLLRQGFQRTLAYEAALAGRKALVIGRKGSGKSAICAQLAHGGVHPGPTAPIAPDDAAGDEIRRFDLQGLTSDTAKSLVWRYLFAVHAARHVVAHAPYGHGRALRQPAAVRALRDFLKANGEDTEARLTDRLKRGTSRLQSATLSLKMFGIEAGLQASPADDGRPEATLSEGARAMRQLEALETGVTAALDSLECAALGHPPLLVLVDQLEHVWRADTASHALVTGLLLATKHVARTYGSAVRCVLFVRSDIYGALNFVDGDKFRSDEMHITWTDAALRELALTRASVSLGRELTHDELWGDIFPRTVRGETTAGYLAARCLPRPRDAIQFLNLCRDTAWERGHPTVRESDVLAATKRFSEWKLEDLAREYNVGFPFLREVFGLFEHGEYQVRRGDLETRFSAIRAALHAAYAAYTEALNARVVIQALFAIGFLGVRRQDGVAYAGSTSLPVQPYEDEFYVHPCFRPALHCTEGAAEGRGGSVVLVGASPRHARERLLRTTAASDVGFSRNRDARWIDEMGDVGTRLLRHLARSGLPDAARRDVEEGLTTALVAIGGAVSSSSESIDTRLRTAIDVLEALATRLVAEGHGGEPVTLRLADEALVLEGLLGGSVGGAGSDSLG